MYRKRRYSSYWKGFKAGKRAAYRKRWSTSRRRRF